MKHSISGLIKKSLVVAVAATLIACGGAEERKEKYLEKGEYEIEFKLGFELRKVTLKLK